VCLADSRLVPLVGHQNIKISRANNTKRNVNSRKKKKHRKSICPLIPKSVMNADDISRRLTDVILLNAILAWVDVVQNGVGVVAQSIRISEELGIPLTRDVVRGLRSPWFQNETERSYS
jgi:hypothetical protein